MTKPRRLALGIAAAGLVCALLGLALGGIPRLLLWWTALACTLVAVAYLANRPGLFPKRDGRLVWWRALPILPYLAAYAVATGVRRRKRRYAGWDEVAAGLYVGARLPAAELPGGLELVIDLTCEIPEPAALRRHPGYRCLPVLDGSFPDDEDRFLELLDEMAVSAGSIYIHCISGRGRAPTAAAALLLARGIADAPAAAIEMVRKGRPVTALTRTDVRFLERIAARLLRP